MKIKLAIIALVFCGISIVYDSYSLSSMILLVLHEEDAGAILLLAPIAFMLPKIAVLCLSIAVLLPYKKTADLLRKHGGKTADELKAEGK